MIFSALLLIAAPQLEAFDAANLALTSCAFAVHRSANEQDLSDSQFAGRLSADCSQQIAGLRRSMTDVNVSRGETAAAAARKADSVLARLRAAFAKQYTRRAEDEKQLRALKRALEQEGKTGAQ